MMGTGSPSTYTKLIDIKDFPDLGGSPEMLETTTLSDPSQTYIKGIQSLDSLEFTANYTVEDFQKIKAITGDKPFAVWLGGDADGSPTGSHGKFTFNGEIDVFVVGAGVNEVVDMTVTIAPSTPIEFSAD